MMRRYPREGARQVVSRWVVSRWVVSFLVVSALLAAMARVGAAAAADTQSARRLQVERITLNWSKHGRLAAIETMAKYGPPQEITAERLVWHGATPFERITAYGRPVPHDFPLAHFDVLEHTVSYPVPLDKVEEVLRFDGSITVDRTAGELSARCDSESRNVLALNLAHDVAEGKSAVEARRELVDILKQELLGHDQDYAHRLQFAPLRVTEARITDSPGMIGAPVSAGDFGPQAREKRRANGGKQDEAEMLALLIAVDLNQIDAAETARDKNLSPAVSAFARQLHHSHGQNVFDSMEVGQRIAVTPVNTQRVLRARERGAAEAAALVPLNAARFERNFLKTLVQAQAVALRQLDDMIAGVDDGALRRHLLETQLLVAGHHERAQQLQRAPGS